MRMHTGLIVAAALVLPTLAFGGSPNNARNFNAPSNFNGLPNMGTSIRHGRPQCHDGYCPGGVSHPSGRTYKGHFYAYGEGPCWKEADGRYHWIC